MNKIDILIKAINNKSQIQYDYIKDWVSEWRRIWNPHILYVYKSKKDWQESTKCDIFQISWWTKSWELNKFKMCNIECLDNIKILDITFEEDKQTYNPNWDRYLFTLAKV